MPKHDIVVPTEDIVIDTEDISSLVAEDLGNVLGLKENNVVGSESAYAPS